MKNIESFKEELEHLKKSMDQLAIGEKRPIYDGPIDADNYFKAKIKILWILKEAYDKENNGKGGFEYSEYLNQDNLYDNFLKNQKHRSTWYPLIFTCYGILNDFVLYDKVSFIEEEPAVADIIHNIAIININKLAGGTTSHSASLQKNFTDNQSLLSKQINILEPDIIIGGGTLGYFYNLLELDRKRKKISAFGTVYFCDDKRIYINARHPAYRIPGKYRFVYEPYVNDIITICKNEQALWQSISKQEN